jgi:hypothetical protein
MPSRRSHPRLAQPHESVGGTAVATPAGRAIAARAAADAAAAAAGGDSCAATPQRVQHCQGDVHDTHAFYCCAEHGRPEVALFDLGASTCAGEPLRRRGGVGAAAARPARWGGGGSSSSSNNSNGSAALRRPRFTRCLAYEMTLPGFVRAARGAGFWRGDGASDGSGSEGDAAEGAEGAGGGGSGGCCTIVVSADVTRFLCTRDVSDACIGRTCMVRVGCSPGLAREVLKMKLVRHGSATRLTLDAPLPAAMLAEVGTGSHPPQQQQQQQQQARRPRLKLQAKLRPLGRASHEVLPSAARALPRPWQKDPVVARIPLRAGVTAVSWHAVTGAVVAGLADNTLALVGSAPPGCVQCAPTTPDGLALVGVEGKGAGDDDNDDDWV